jgi:hypothetical protein
MGKNKFDREHRWKLRDERDYVAMWWVLLGFPLAFAIMISLSLLRLFQGLSGFLASFALVNMLYPGPTIGVANYILLLSVALFASSIAACIRGRVSVSKSIVGLAEMILLVITTSSYFANIGWRFVAEYLRVRIGFSILTLVIGTIPAAICIPIVLDFLVSHFWIFILGYTPGIFRGDFYHNMEKAWKKGKVQRTISSYLKVSVVAFAIYLVILVILVILGWL